MSNALQASSYAPASGSSSLILALFMAVNLIFALLILLIIFYFIVSGVIYLFRKKFLGPKWLPKAALIIFVLIILLNYFFPDLFPLIGV